MTTQSIPTNPPASNDRPTLTAVLRRALVGGLARPSSRPPRPAAATLTAAFRRAFGGRR